MGEEYSEYALVGAIPLTAGDLLTRVEGLGQRWRATIGGADVDLMLPVIVEHETPSGLALLGPPISIPEYHISWGGGDENEGALYVSALAIGIRPGGDP